VCHHEPGPDGHAPQHGQNGLKMVVCEVFRLKIDFQVSLHPAAHLGLTRAAGNYGASGQRQGLGSCGRGVRSHLYGDRPLLSVIRHPTPRGQVVRRCPGHSALVWYPPCRNYVPPGRRLQPAVAPFSLVPDPAPRPTPAQRQVCGPGRRRKCTGLPAR
jgi:hypothetical protein